MGGFTGRDAFSPENDPNYVDPQSLMTPEDLAIDFRINTEYGKKQSIPKATDFYFRLSKSVYNPSKELKKPLNPYDMLVDLEIQKKLPPGSDISKRPFSYYIYEGSLTSPPCDEYTTLIIKSDPVQLNFSALDLLRDVFNPQPLTGGGPGCQGASGVGNFNIYDNQDGTNRNIQPTKGRAVYHYSAAACDPSSMIPQNAPGD